VLLKLHSREAFYLHIAYNLEAIQVPSYIFLKKQSAPIEKPVDKRKCGEPGILCRWVPEGKEGGDGVWCRREKTRAQIDLLKWLSLCEIPAAINIA